MNTASQWRTSAAILALALLASACQPRTTPATVESALDAVSPAVAVSSTTETGVGEAEAAPSPEPAMVTKAVPPVTDVPSFLTINNLAPLWQADFGQDDAGISRPTILDGFFGAEHRHISMLFERVTQDSIDPTVFRVQGRSRFRKNIIPFVGAITVKEIKPYRILLDLDSFALFRTAAYVATARFVLKEDATVAGAGLYQGVAFLDFCRSASGELNIIQTSQSDELGTTGGGGQLFRGQWQSYRTGKQRSVAFATYTKAVLPGTMSDFFLGDRGEGINPKYGGLDWNEAWENDEWWATSPKRALPL